MKNCSILILLSCIALTACMFSCAPSGRIVMVKAHTVKNAVATVPSKSNRIIAALPAKTTATNIDNQFQAVAVTLIKLPVSSKPDINSRAGNTSTQQSVVKSHLGLVIHSLHLKTTSFLRAGTQMVMKTEEGHRHSHGILGAIALMIIGILLALFFTVPNFGYIIGIAGSLIFLIGLIYLVAVIL